MIILAIASMLAAASIDTAASAQRAALAKCLDLAVANAKSAKIDVDAFDTFMRSQCATPEANLRKAVMAIDVKNGVSRKEAAEYARMDVEDYFLSILERYEAELGRMQPEPAQAQAQAQPQQPQLEPAQAQAQAQAQQPQQPQPQQ